MAARRSTVHQPSLSVGERRRAGGRPGGHRAGVRQFRPGLRRSHWGCCPARCVRSPCSPPADAAAADLSCLHPLVAATGAALDRCVRRLRWVYLQRQSCAVDRAGQRDRRRRRVFLRRQLGPWLAGLRPALPFTGRSSGVGDRSRRVCPDRQLATLSARPQQETRCSFGIFVVGDTGLVSEGLPLSPRNHDF